MSERSWAEIGGSGRVGLSQVIREANDNYVRADNADVTVSAPISYTKYNTVAPDNITAEILSNAAHSPNTGALTTAYAATNDMVSQDHTVYIKLGTQTWSATNDFIGVMVRANSPTGGSGDRSAYGFVISRAAGPVYNCQRVRWDAGSLVGNVNAGTIAGPPSAGDYLACTVSGGGTPSLALKQSVGGAAFSTIATATPSTTLTGGLRGGWTMQQGGAGTNLRITGLWLDRAPF